MTHETGWTCPRCKHFNIQIMVCENCGLAFGEPGETQVFIPPSERPERPAKEELARLLNLMAQTPNLRARPQSGDLPGSFNEWFDGGARRFITGYTEYEFADGGRAIEHVLTYMRISITLPNGISYSISQSDR